MATGKVARRTAVVDVAALLDSPEVEALIASIEAVGDKRGRKGFGTRALYRGRAAVERAFGDLKNNYGLAPLRVRGLERVALHADLVMLARLGQALIRAREQTVPMAA